MGVNRLGRRWWGITIGPLDVTWYDLWESKYSLEVLWRGRVLIGERTTR